MKYCVLLLFFFSSGVYFSQQKFSKEISFVNDNDLYTSTIKDRYYTNGIFFNYRYLSKKENESLEKKIFQWQLGQKMYSPFKAIVTLVKNHDRPFAGYLYGGFEMTNVYQNNKIFSTSLEIGTLGENAFAKEVQDFIHNIYGFKKAIGWEYQIKNALGVNFGANYNTLIAKDGSNFFDITWINSANIGTIFTDFSSGFYGRIGFKPLQKIANSIAFKTNLNNQNTADVREIESFLFVKPSLKYVIYDATIQGSFLNTKSLVTKEIIPLVFKLEIGLKFTSNRFHYGYTFNYTTSESKGLRFDNGNNFGTIEVHYLLY